VSLESSNYLYRHPELYDSVFRTAPTAPRLKDMARAVLARYGKEPPSTVLDIGCGTGFKLAHLRDLGYRCVGVDPIEAMVDYARGEYPGIEFAVGDLRDVRVGRTFDVITALGWVIENVHTRGDISCAMDTLAAHARPGTLLLFDTHNPIGDLHAQGSRSEFSIDRGGLRARATATFDVDRRRQILTRRRTWELDDGCREEDLAHFRLFFPMELEHHLDQHGFDVLGMWDNTDLADSALDGSMLHVAASFRGSRAP
jgi:SAM-dependent methyltransferase